MKKFLILFGLPLIALFLRGSLSIVEPRYDEALSLTQLKTDLKLLRQNLETVHPALYLYTPKESLDRCFEQIEASLKTGMHALDLYRLLLPLNKLIANGHSKINPPASYIESLQTDSLRFPFQLYHRHDTLYVLEDLSKEQVVGKGKQILSINGESMDVLFAQMCDNIPRDGYNQTLPAYAASYAFARYYAYFYGCAERFDLSFREADDSIKTASIKALPLAEILAQKPSLAPQNRPQKASYTFERRAEAAVMKIGSFQPEKARDYRKFLAETFTSLEDEPSAALILDLRHNGGGYPEASWQLLEYLIAAPVQPTLAEYAMVDKIPTPHNFEEEMFFKHFHRQNIVPGDSLFVVKGADKVKLKPQKNAYRGPLYVLMNAASASATGEFLGQLKTHTEAIFVGEEAGSNPVSQTASDLLKLILPHSKIEIVLPAIQSVSRVDFANDGHGVRPDIECVPRIETILAGEDEVLAKVCQIIEARN
ncbi:MAG: S41 family peptidase [Bacteroidia bacterium]